MVIYLKYHILSGQHQYDIKSALQPYTLSSITIQDQNI